MSVFIAAPRVWLGILITVEVAAAYGCLTALALWREALDDGGTPP